MKDNNGLLSIKSTVYYVNDTHKAIGDEGSWD